MSATLILWDDRNNKVSTEDIGDGVWTKTVEGNDHRLFNTFPVECNNKDCGFPVTEIIGRDLQKRTVTLECPRCHNRIEYSPERTLEHAPERAKVIEVMMEAVVFVRLTNIEAR